MWRILCSWCDSGIKLRSQGCTESWLLRPGKFWYRKVHTFAIWGVTRTALENCYVIEAVESDWRLLCCSCSYYYYHGRMIRLSRGDNGQNKNISTAWSGESTKEGCHETMGEGLYSWGVTQVIMRKDEMKVAPSWREIILWLLLSLHAMMKRKGVPPRLVWTPRRSSVYSVHWFYVVGVGGCGIDGLLLLAYEMTRNSVCN